MSFFTAFRSITCAAVLLGAVLLGAVLLGAVAAVGSGPANAQAPAASTKPDDVKSGTYKADTDHTRIIFSLSHLGFTTYYGEFSGASGSLTVKQGNPAATTVEIKLPTASISTTSPVLTGELKTADWLDASKFPEITFKSTRVVANGSTAEVTGDLTFHGVTKPVTLSVRFNAAGIDPIDKTYTVGFDATGRIRRSEFGVKAYVPAIGDEVSLLLSAEFKQ